MVGVSLRLILLILKEMLCYTRVGKKLKERLDKMVWSNHRPPRLMFENEACFGHIADKSAIAGASLQIN
jgi:hypothetical protein